MIHNYIFSYIKSYKIYTMLLSDQLKIFGCILFIICLVGISLYVTNSFYKNNK